MRRQVRRLARRTACIRGEIVVMKDDACQRARETVCLGWKQAVFEHAAQRVALSGALTATDEDA